MHSTIFNNTRNSKVPSLRGTFGKEGGGEAKLLLSPFPSGALWHRCLFISVLLIDGFQSILLLSTVYFSGFSSFVALNFGVRVFFEKCKYFFGHFFAQFGNLVYDELKYSRESQLFLLNPLSFDIKMHILITDLHTFLMTLVRRICLNIKTSHPQ